MSSTHHASGDATMNNHDEEEHSTETPLLRSRDDQPEEAEEEEEAKKTHFSIAFLIALTCINGGLQVFFSTVMANLAPYLQNLGLSKSTTAAIIISIPLSGAIVGPSVGTFSDRLRTRWGRRRPIILFGAGATVAFMMLLAWTEEFVRWGVAGCSSSSSSTSSSSSSSGEHECSGTVDAFVTAFAVIWTVCLAIAIQPVQAGCRALTVDIVPAHEQSRASAYASRIQGAMAIFSFWASSLTFSEFSGLEKLTQFQALACLNFITLGSTVLLTCLVVKEKDSRRLADQEDAMKKRTTWGFFKEIWRNIWRLPEKINLACKVQFASWTAWFPLLFYTTTYIGELATVTDQPDNGNDQLAQAGSIASLCFAIVGFIAVLALPALQSHFYPNNTKSLVYLWTFTQPLLGLLLVLTLASAYPWQGIVLIAMAGVPWAVTQWVPWALIGFETSRLGAAGKSDGEREDYSEEGGSGDGDGESGAILGIHNMAISLPQVLSGAVSIVTYRFAEAAGSEVPTAWVLASSGFAAFGAGWLAGRML